MRSRPLFALTFAATLVAAGSAQAQSAGNGFLFKEPVVGFSLMGGLASPQANSDVFSFITSELTVSKTDFRSATFGADFSVRVAPRLDLVVGGRYSGTSKPSEFRNFVDNNNFPIQQTTSFARVPLTVSLKTYLVPRGRAIGHFAWIPARYMPFIGVGGGAMWYQLKQDGDFIDPDTKNVFSDTFNSSGWTPTAHALAGMDIALSQHFGLTGEGRYTYAKGNLSSDFSGFDRIDLSGLSATVGFYARF
jgi:hypothetical protein